MSVDYSVFGVNANEEREKAKARESAAFMEENDITVPSELYDIIERDRIHLDCCLEKVNNEHSTEYIVKVSDVPKHVDHIVFRVS